MSLRLTEEEYARYLRRGQPAPLAEAAWQAAVMRLAKQYGWMAYHTFDSRKSPSGYPDCTLVHPGGARPLIFAELKTDTGIVSQAQAAWLEALAGCTGVVADIWRPADMAHVIDVLRR
jgi:hypothetical protein